MLKKQSPMNFFIIGFIIVAICLLFAWGKNIKLSSELVSHFQNAATEETAINLESIETIHNWSMSGLIITIVLTALFVASLFFRSHSTTSSSPEMLSNLKILAEGDGYDVEKISRTEEEDHTNEFAVWFNSLINKLKSTINRISDRSVYIDGTSKEALLFSGLIENSAKEVNAMSKKVITDIKQLGGNLSSVAAALDKASTNVNVVDTATKHISSTVNEIALNSENAKNITDEAVSQIKTTSEEVAELGNAAIKIGRVTEVIAEISEQTKLLALNATIEAARAGEAGKGFMVVANEIKELARQTANANSEIKVKISSIQNSSSGTVDKISKTSDVIYDINDTVSSIAAAIEEQNNATREISGNISQISTGVKDILENVAESSDFANNIAIYLSDFEHITQEISAGGSNIKHDANDMLKVGEELKKIAS